MANPDRSPEGADPTKTTLRKQIARAQKLVPPTGPEDLLNFARTMTFHAVSAYWSRLDTGPSESQPLSLRTPPPGTNCQSLPAEAQELAEGVGRSAAGLEALHAAHALGSLYTETMPAKLRSELGAYHTAPALCERLLDIAEDAGVDWSTARVMDPASGGGAFLAPCARRMLKDTPERAAGTELQSIEDRLRGVELDPFAAWMSQVFLDAALRDLQNAPGRRPGPAVNVGNALETSLGMEGFDLVIGNPPRGRVSLPPHLRRAYERSLSGHANMYALFLDLALRLTRPGGTVALIIPTSFLAGQYFRGLRRLMAQEAPIARIEFIAQPVAGSREGHQETAFVVCRRGAGAGPGEVHFTQAGPDERAGPDKRAETTGTAQLRLPPDPEGPWMVPRQPEQAPLVRRAAGMPHRLSDHGYEVKTGPLVWHKHRDALRSGPGEGRLPLVWAESVRPGGVFEFRWEQRGHQPYLAIPTERKGLVTRAPCVLVQRTTARQQAKRLIAAELPHGFDALHGGVVVENHLNIIRPKEGRARISTGALAALLNSEAADQLFRCMNGSVAVSAYELEALPLPPPERMGRLEELVERNADRRALEQETEGLYEDCP